MKKFQCIALTPPGLADPSIAIAACRAGELGVLDLEYANPDDNCLEAISKLTRYAHNACGLKINGSDKGFFTRVTDNLPEEIKIIILAQPVFDDLKPQVHILHKLKRIVLIEVTCLDDALKASSAKADGLIVKGNEAGGRVGEESTFILLQRVIKKVSLPVWAQGGIGLHTAAACYAAGAAGVALDSQLALTRESPFPQHVKEIMAKMDGNESVCLGSEIGDVSRVYARPYAPVIKELMEIENNIIQNSHTGADALNVWRKELRTRAGWSDPEKNVWLLGQDVAFASSLGRRFKTVGGVLEAIRKSVAGHIKLSCELKPLSEKSPMALSHGTRFPIVQGPMARISDKAEFLAGVAEEGALPFFAMGMSGKSEIEKPLQETRLLLKDRPWGIGILGFARPEILNEQMALIKTLRPPFALIAGGRPEQALALEQDGIATYMHVPSPALLKLLLDKGIRRFIFEGRECGGHIGPRSSFMLWDQAIDVLLETLPENELSDCHVLFAGGINDALSSSMVSALAAPLAERGVKVGVQMGTAYLFTREAVASGAIVKGYQEEAVRCSKTVILETGPGHASRCAATAYAGGFKNIKSKLIADGKAASEITDMLENLNLGRLRIASRGIDRNPEHAGSDKAPRYIKLKKKEQSERGMYLIGQVAALHDRPFSIKKLHQEVSVNGCRRLSDLRNPISADASTHQTEGPCDIAIIGMSCLMPQAAGLQAYWENILNKVNTITEIPRERWDWKLYYDQDPKTRDKVNSRWGAFLDKAAFDPVVYGIPPNKLDSIEPLHLLALKTAHAALKDAGYDDRPFPRERTSVIVGGIGGFSDLFQQYAFRSNLPRFIRNVSTDALSIIPEWTEDSFAGILTNVAAGRVANFFDLGGVNFTVDAACATSLAALSLAVRELNNKTSDMMLVGAADTCQNPFTYTCFSKTYTFSPDGKCRPFDMSANGIVIGEGVAFLVLKRLADAERDGDRIYAVIKSVGGSSDGRGKGMSAPNIKGQTLAVKRAYDKAGFSSASVGLVEAHGTGTVVGDRVEINVLRRLFKSGGAGPQSCAIGSVKSMIGHTKSAAGMAGIIKVAMALHHKILPPTTGVEKPNSTLSGGPLYINADLRPWIQGAEITPRRAGVSSFGFGGTNFHAVIEEYTDDFITLDDTAVFQNWPSELFLWNGNSREEIISMINSLSEALNKGGKPVLRDLSYTLWENSKLRTGPRLAIVAASLEDLQKKLLRAVEKLKVAGEADIQDPSGIYFAAQPIALEGKIAFLFPGQGSQYPDMLRDITVSFPEVRERFEIADNTLRDCFSKPLSSYIYPPSRFSEEEEKDCKKNIAQTNIAQPALGAANMGLYCLMNKLGIKPDMVAGHSYGEYAALCAAGAYDEKALYRISEARGRFIMEEAGRDLGTMAAVEAGPESISEIITSVENVWIANINSPKQTVISGSSAGIHEVIGKLQEKGINTRPVAVSCAFHSPMVSPVRDKLKGYLDSLDFTKPAISIFSNTTADRYPEKPDDISSLLSDHLINPVRFIDEINAMYNSGARIFVEVGPRRVLTNLTQQILGERPHLALPLDVPGRNGLLQLHHALGQLSAHNVPVNLDRLYHGRSVRKLNLDSLIEDTGEHYTSTTWLVDGGRAIPVKQFEKEKLSGDAPAAAMVGEAVNKETDTDQKARKPANTDSDVPYKNTAYIPDSVQTSVLEDGDLQNVMLNHQKLMQRFLETQQQVMLAFLRGTASEDALKPDKKSSAISGLFKGPSQALPPLRPKTSATAKPAEQGMTVPVSDQTQQTAASAGGADKIKEDLIQIISDRTGYPPDMLDPVLDLEADLGVDSIKRTEILGVLQKKYPELIKGGNGTKTEELTRIKTLKGMNEWIENSLPSFRGTSVPAGGGSSIEHKVVASEVPQDSVPAVDADKIKEDLIQIISERTGYPPDMLDPALDLEADLGVDSIKRTEILGVLNKKYPELIRGGNGTKTEELTRIKTLRGINEWISGSFQSQARESKDMPLPVREKSETGLSYAGEDSNEVIVPRFLLKTIEAALQNIPLQVPSGSVFIITSDGGNVSQAVSEKVRQAGARVVLVQMGDALVKTGEGLYSANLCDHVSVQSLVELVSREQGPVAGIIHLLPLKSKIRYQEMTLKDWQTSLRQDVKSLFYLARAAGKDINQSADKGGGWLIAATSSDGTENMSPGRGGIAGLIKTIAIEWPRVNCKVIDYESLSPLDSVVDSLMNEIAMKDPEIQVAYRDARRFVTRAELSSLDQRGPAHSELGPDSVIMITGGARGVTAETACALAGQFRPTILLVGLSSLPAEEEPQETAGITSPVELKKALIDRFRSAGRDVKLSQVEAAYSRVCRDREIRKNIERMEKAGARVRYYQADVRNEESFGSLIDRIYDEYGKIDGVLHGAGIIEDKLVLDKDPVSFDRVFDTKTDSANILSRKLRPDSLKLLVFFSSVSGSFGSRGQCDYAATNDEVNKLALYLDRQWPGRIMAVNWGPWDKDAGMVSGELRKKFLEEGVQLIPHSAGSRALVDEILYGHKGQVEVIIGDGPWPLELNHFPLIEGIQLDRMNGDAVEMKRTLDPAHDLYLKDHVLDGKPVFPVAMAMELMAEVVQKAWPELKVTGIRALSVLRGIILENGSKEILVAAKPKPDQPADNTLTEIEVEISGPGKPGLPNFQAVVQLAEKFPEPPPFDAARLPELRPFPKTVEECYTQWLFHGPCLQGITEIEGMSEQAISVRLRSIPPDECFSGGSRGQWLLDPVIIDSAFQPALLWERVKYNMTPLPSAITSFKLYGTLSGLPLQCYMQIKTSGDGHMLIADIYLLDTNSHLRGIIENMEFTCSENLNRLAGHVKSYRGSNS